MSVKKTATIVLGVAALGIGGMTALQPKTPAELEQSRLDQQIQDLGDSQEMVEERRRAEGESLGNALQEERNLPGEHRLPEEPRLPRFRIRIP
jgi:hypothetical protein